MKRPAFQFYPADWRKDNALRSCSIAARGLWMELCCVMHECEPYGHLTTKTGEPMDWESAAQLCGVEAKLYRKLLTELEAKGTAYRTADGILYSKRMVKDERLRLTRAASGSKGGNPNLVAHKDKQNTDLVNHAPKQSPTPSSSSSSSLKTGVGVTPTIEARAPSTPMGDNSPGTSTPKINGDAWWKTPDGVLAHGQAKGVAARKGETSIEYKARLFALEYPNQPLP